MNIDKAIIHRYAETLECSETPLSLTEDTELFLLKISKGFQSSTAISKALLGERSALNAIINTQYAFIDISTSLTKRWFALVGAQEKDQTTTCIYAQVDKKDGLYFEAYYMNGKPAFLDEQTQIDAVNTALPSTLAGCFFAMSLNLETGDLDLKASSDYQEHLESFLNITIYPNAKTSMSHVSAMVQALATGREEPVHEAQLTMKQYITDNTPFIDTCLPTDILNRVFPHQTDQESTYIASTIDMYHLDEPYSSR